MNTLEKIKALLAQAEGTPYEGEAEVFMAKAHELMDKYKIELADLEGLPEASAVTHKVHISPKNGKYLRALAYQVAPLFYVKVLYVTRGRSTRIYIVGLQNDIDTFERVFVRLYEEMFRTAKPVCAGWGKSAFNSFYSGFIAGVSSKVRELLYAREKSEVNHTTKALVVVHNENNEAYVVEQWGKVRNASNTFAYGSAEGYYAGKNASLAAGEIED